VWFLAAIGGLLLTLLGNFLARDAYACLPSVQIFLIQLASMILPSELRDDVRNQWLSDIPRLIPSEIRRTFFALGCIKAAAVVACDPTCRAKCSGASRASLSSTMLQNGVLTKSLNAFFVLLAAVSCLALYEISENTRTLSVELSQVNAEIKWEKAQLRLQEYRVQVPPKHIR
jgi:hypothetical protein